MMRALILSILMICIAAPISAQWRTTKAHPVEKDSRDHVKIIEDFFFDNDGVADVQSELSLPLTVIFDQFSFDLKKMALANFPEPLVEPYLETPGGEVFIPIFSEDIKDKNGNSTGGGQYNCETQIISLSNTSAKISSGPIHQLWAAGRSKFQELLDLVVVFLDHEVLHAIQAKAGWLCAAGGPAVTWYREGTADGLAHYFLSHRNPDALRDYSWARNERLYSKELVSDEGKIEYESGSFFRYLIEATETDGQMNLALARDLIVGMKSISASSRIGVLENLEEILREHNSDRPVAMTLAEFHTEYASYGGVQGRYNQDLKGWYLSAFGMCIEFDLAPGDVASFDLSINQNAARCIRVNWKNFKQASALQIYTTGKSENDGALHMGQAHVGPSEANLEACYDVTSFIDNRLAAKASWKCMLRRSAIRILADGTEEAVDGWTSDFNLVGDGFTYLVLTNANDDLVYTVPKTVTLRVGSNLVKDETGQSLPPRQDVKNPVKDGLSLLDSRVHAFAAGSGRILVDGRSVAGSGLEPGFLQGVPGAGEIDAGGAFVRTRDYMVALIKDKAGVPNSAMIMRDPSASLGGAVITLGSPGMPPIPSCGYRIPADLEILEQTDEVFRFRVAGDLFNFSPSIMMNAGGSNMCDLLQAAHVEFKSLEVSLPMSALYDGTARVERAFPPMQDLYDEKEYTAGPSFGGIATSRSLVFGDATSAQTSGGAGENANAGGAIADAACNCHCPNIISPVSGQCFATCESTLSQCPDPVSSAAKASDVARYSEILLGNSLTETTRETLLADFERMSPATRSQIIREALSN